MLKKYTVFGNPISHSISPKIHQEFASQFKKDISYTTTFCEINEFENKVNDFFNLSGAIGANITLPFKEKAFAMCEKLSKRAKISGAVNTIYMKDGKLHGDNTDGAGFALDLKRLEQSLCNKNILLLGAGGAARNIISEIADLNPKFIEIRNRSADKAENIKNIIGDLKNIKTTKTDKMKFDVVINSTSLSLKNILPDVRVEELNKQAFCYDLAYEKNNETVFTRWAKENECSSCGGLGMLVGQAAEAFYIWNKDMPNSKICLEKLLANKI